MERVTHKHVSLVIFQQRDATLQGFFPLFSSTLCFSEVEHPPCSVPMLKVYMVFKVKAHRLKS